MPENNPLAYALFDQKRNKSPIQAPNADVFSNAAPIGNVASMSSNPFAMGHATGDMLRRRAAQSNYLDALQQSNMQAGQLADLMSQRDTQSQMYGDALQHLHNYGQTPGLMNWFAQQVGGQLSPGDMQSLMGNNAASMLDALGSGADTLHQGGMDPTAPVNAALARGGLPQSSPVTPTNVRSSALVGGRDEFSSRIPDSSGGTTTIKRVRDVAAGQPAGGTSRAEGVRGEGLRTQQGQPATEQDFEQKMTSPQATKSRGIIMANEKDPRYAMVSGSQRFDEKGNLIATWVIKDETGHSTGTAFDVIISPDGEHKTTRPYALGSN